jgi:hypothetical protein
MEYKILYSNIRFFNIWLYLTMVVTPIEEAAASKVNCTGVHFFDRRRVFIAWRQVNYIIASTTATTNTTWLLVTCKPCCRTWHIYLNMLSVNCVSRALSDPQNKRFLLVGLRAPFIKQPRKRRAAGCCWQLLHGQTTDRVWRSYVRRRLFLIVQ